MSHPYAGNPANYPIAITLMDDGVDVPSFTNFNTGYEGLADRGAYLFGLVGGLVAKNWQAAFTPSGQQACDLAWNPVLRSWQFVYYNSGATQFNAAPFTGMDQTGGGTPVAQSASSAPLSAACDANGVLYVCEGNNVYSLAPGGASWITLDGGAGNSPVVVAGVGANWASVWEFVGGEAFVWGPSNTAHSFSTVITGGPLGATWLMASNGSNAVLVVPKVANSSLWVGTSSALNSISMTGAGLGTTDVPVAIAWNTSFGAWIMAVSVAGGTATAFYASASGTGGWTKLSQISSMRAWGVTSGAKTAIGASDMKCVGALMVVRSYDSSAHASWLAYSADGVNWYPSETILYGMANANLGLKASDTQLGMVYVGATADQLQFSISAGLPATALS